MTELTAAKPLGLDAWLNSLEGRDLPVLGTTARSLWRLSEADDTNVAELANLIMQDAAMTTGVLRLANSVYYNPGARDVTTISRAVVVLGFNTVRAMGLSLAVIDELRTSIGRERSEGVLISTFTAAVIAKLLARGSGDAHPEEVFIACLLARLGELAFWCHAPETVADQVAYQLTIRAGQRAPEKSVLGFSFDEMTQGLARRWHLGELLLHAQMPEKAGNGRVACIQEALFLEQCLRANGWHSDSTRAALKGLAQRLHLPRGEMRMLVERLQHQLDHALAGFGLKQISRQTADTDKQQCMEVITPNPSVQLQVLQDLARAIQDPNQNWRAVVSTALEGLHRGGGLDRAVAIRFDGGKPVIESAIGIRVEPLREFLGGDWQQPTFDIMRFATISGRAVWASQIDPRETSMLNLADFRASVRGWDFFLAPMLLNGEARGVVYADRIPSKRFLDQDAFAAFNLFVSQVRLGLEYMLLD